ncbi:MAG: Rne/Rng family ribonuclease [Cyanobacteria bacterium SID2]|nr:Rne/Rng family ribonuclease [Cyanobacteria bacterium SID2]MBP0002672.1 Rne/Rng family ribonuclease [Cyanobacteria bacterium SBC]
MPKQIIIAEQHRIAAVFFEDRIQELVVATGTHQVSDIYVGVVENVIPGIDAAFVNIGDPERNGFMHVTDLGPLRLKRSAGAITELLTPQQKVLVQVMKEPTGNKGPRLTGNITLPGRYLVLMPFGKGVHLSRRILREAERNRLRALAILVKPAGMGLLVRTEAEGVSEDAIMEDLEVLQRQWETVQEEYNTTKDATLLNRDDDFIQRVLRDMYSGDVNRIVVDSHTGLKRVKQQLTNWNNGKLPQGVSIDHHREALSILEYFRVNAAVREALKPRVDLPSGGYIIIEPTEALTVIDVNSGSFTRSATSRETVLWTNCEAATEIARQLRLRNIAGVIVVDFIDMDSRRDQLQVLEHFTKALSTDKARPQIAQLSELGLVELTRKRQGQNIYELFSHPCPACGGLGHAVRLPGEPATVPSPEVESAPAAAAPRISDAPAPPSPQPRTRDRSRLPKALEPLREALNDTEFDPASEGQELDLIHHPSYQELGDGGSRRRRRRRFTGAEVKPYTDPAAKMPSKEEPVLQSSRSIELRPSLASASPDLESESVSEGEPETPEKLPRARSISPRESKVEETPEVVTVEMTPEEQNVYALMGISPLVKLDRPVKNPKSAMISIVIPGEKREGEANGTSHPSSANGFLSEEDRPTPTPAETTNEQLPLPEETDADDEVAVEPTEKSQKQSVAKIRAGATRRRRRRSSATSDDS